MIVCRNVSKSFGALPAVNDVSFRVDGGICALLGPNGAGKSTLLGMLTGLIAPSAGEVAIAGFNTHRQPLEVKRIVGVVPEQLGLFDSLTVEEHLTLCGPVYGLTAEETAARADQLLRVLGLEHGRATFLDRCSHGMRKKTALAMALLHNPHVLFLDEPFEGIDPMTAESIRNLLTAISARGVTVFFTSHILSIVDRLATQILMIRSGSIVWNSATADIARPIEELYFELVQPPITEELAWLGSPQS